MQMVGTYEIGLDTPINMLTPRQLFEMLNEWQGSQPKQETPTDTSKKWYVNSMDELAEILGTSDTTLYRMKSQGLLDECISQFGRWMIIDVNMVVEKFKLSNRKRKKKTG